MLTMMLPWPPKELSPNARVHFHVKAKATKAYREQAYWQTRGGDSDIFPCSPIETMPVYLNFTFHPPDKRRRDLDTMLSSVKAGIDGIADALGVNDARFEYTLRRAEPVKGGKVMIVIR